MSRVISPVEKITLQATVVLGELAELSYLAKAFPESQYKPRFERLAISTEGYVDTLSDLIEGLNK